MMRVLVCGGRNYDDSKAVGRELDALLTAHGSLVVIEGGANGADKLARRWAVVRMQGSVTVPADWANLGASAGPRRNQLMLDREAPELVLAFPGGRGTADMVRRARRAGVTVKEI